MGLQTNGKWIWNGHDLAILTHIFAKRLDDWKWWRLLVRNKGERGGNSSDRHATGDGAMIKRKPNLESARDGDQKAYFRVRVVRLEGVEIGCGMCEGRMDIFQRPAQDKEGS
jgi:hypothetical protein